MFFVQTLLKGNQFEKYFIIALVTFECITVCKANILIPGGVGEWSQDSETVTLFYKSDNKDPKLFLALAGHLLHLQIGDDIKEVIYLEGEVKWPVEWLIDHTSGAVKIKMGKKVQQNWSTLNVNTRLSAYNKEFWKGLITETKKITEDSYLVRIKMVNQVFQHVPVGRHVALRKTLKVSNENETKAYTTVPIIQEAMKLTTETWRSSDEKINFLIKRYEKGFMSKYVTNPLPTNESTEIYVSTVRGPFLPSFLENKKEVFLFAAGTGITPMISIIVWVLKYQPEITVKLYHFNKEPKFVIWHSELQNLAVNTRGLKFQDINVYSNTEWIQKNNWPGLAGRVTRSMVENAVSTDNKDEQLVVICGMEKFTFFIEDVLTGVLGYEINKNYFPFRKPRQNIPKNVEEFNRLHPTD